MRAVALALFAVAGSALAAAPPSSVIFPDQQLAIKFSHKQHLGLKLQCDFCHDRAGASTSAKDDLTPSEEVCRTCHKIERDQPNKEAKPAARCDACHTGTAASERLVIPPPNLKFNHKVHVDRKVACARCHSVEKLDLATRNELPKMELCLGCHNSTAQAQRAPAKCTTCHITRFDGTMETTFASGILTPSGTMKGDAHTPQFATEHAKVAAQDDKYCESCHRREFCLSCHNGVVKPMTFHANDYVSIHAIDARKATLNCNGCHRTQTFCLGCHERSGVVDPTTANGPNQINSSGPGRRFHPPQAVWSQSNITPEHHKWQAMANIRSCISCHREEKCLECHSDKVTGSTNPHPPGFASTRMCKSLQSRNGRVCLKCHNIHDTSWNCN
jgi:hypothetical protein